MGRDEQHCKGMNFKDLEEHTELSSGMESKKTEAKSAKKCLCVQSSKKTFRSKARWDADEVTSLPLFTPKGSYSQGEAFPISLSCALALLRTLSCLHSCAVLGGM